MLYGVAYRLLGSGVDAEDVLQEAYLRWSAGSRAAVREPRRYLTRVVTRLAIDRLRQRRREPYVGPWLPEPVLTGAAGDPLETVEQRDTVAMATLYLMERLDAVERAVFVLHSAFDLPYAEIAAVVDRTPAHCRQLFRWAADRLGRERVRFAPSRSEHTRGMRVLGIAVANGLISGVFLVLNPDKLSSAGALEGAG